MEYRTTYASPLGTLTLASDGESLTALWLEGQKYFGGTAAEWTQKAEVPVFAAAAAWLDAYFAGTDPGQDLSLSPQGTAFQRRVWQQLLTIPYGTTVSYGELAAALDCPSARAVGGAVGRNPISLIIPCHRVVGANGRLTGYAGGVARKRWLLAHEGIKCTK